MSEQTKENKNDKPVPDPDLEYIVFKGNAKNSKKVIFANDEDKESIGVFYNEIIR